ncbi:MAG: Mur ligase family protein, partial [Syntrophorhabdaceae bacterium]|nr:Mur ligase family protein [Syntrophorhabdaceae bacterium]
MILSAARLDPERVRPGLVRIRLALDRSGRPEEAFRTIHIAGTNGKGSTACMTEAIIRPLAGCAVGLYTSPHLVSPEERIRINGEKIGRRSLARAFLKAETLGEPGDPPTYFEKMTWAACDFFRRGGARLAVMETGLGGRWDATTACHSAVSVITTVGYDHMEWLGSTLGQIAAEKAGILKPGVPLVTGRLRPSARKVVKRRARELGCLSWELGRDFDWRLCPGGTMEVSLPGLRLKDLCVAMDGIFQRDNAAVALAASWMWSGGEGIRAASFAKSAANAVASVRVPGRLAKLSLRRKARCWVDGGHNPEAARALADTIAVSRPWGDAPRVVALW